MLNSLSLRNLLNESAGLHDRIILEDVPSSHRFLTTIIDAMRENRKVLLSYKGFSMETYRDMTVHPYALRIFKRRWYLIGYSEYSEAIRLYMLDRAEDAAILSDVFFLPDEFNAEVYFEDYYGVRSSDVVKERVVLKVMSKIRDLVRTVPLHGSQIEFEANNEYSLFEYFLKPNFDFRQEVISYLGGAEIIEPLWLRREIADTILEMYKKYNAEI
jgi:predicted DNA-binding transcriptional regulator YafY